MLESTAFIQLIGLEKSYGGVRALSDVSIDIRPGEVHAICGENGAGKSTLIRLLTGILQPDHGQIRVEGRLFSDGSVRAAEALGIVAMHQESTAFPDLNAVDNVFAGRELTRWGGVLLDHSAMRRRTAEILRQLGESLPLDVPLGELSLAQRQMAALARALSCNCRLLIMDEPTASLSSRETQTLLQIIRQLRSRGVSILFVSHRLDEVFAIADRISVLRDGSLVATRSSSDLDVPKLIQLMVGRSVEYRRSAEVRGTNTGNVLLEVDGLSRSGVFRDVSFSVRAGEVVGMAGLVGAGRSEIARAIFGIDIYDQGRVFVSGNLVPAGSVPAAVRAGLAMVPEDRQHEGLILPMTVAQNISLVVLRRLTRWGILRRHPESVLVDQQIQSLMIRTDGRNVPAGTLSGGNQQKLVLAKWLVSNPRVLLLDEPTRGVDIGAKTEIHSLIRQLAADGMAVFVISSDMPELLAVCDRVLVLREGVLSGERSAAETDQNELLEMSLPDSEAGVRV